MNKEVTVTLKHDELLHLIKDVIAQIYHIKKIVFNDNWNFGTDITEVEVLTEQQENDLRLFGYYSRKELFDKLNKIERENFQELNCCG